MTAHAPTRPPPAVVLVGHSMGAQVVGLAMADHSRDAPAGVLIGPTADRRARSAPRQALRLARDTAAAPHGTFREVPGRHHAMDADPDGVVAAVLAAGGLA